MRVETEFEYELSLTLKGDWTPRREAKLNALPENCYPAESGELDNLEVFLGPINITNHLANSDRESLFKFLEEYAEECVGDYE